MATALLFDRDQVDEIESWQGELPRIARSAILWIDLESPDEDEIRSLADELELTRQSVEGLLASDGAPNLVDAGSYLHVTLRAPSDPEKRELRTIACLVSKRWIVTVHDAPLAVLDSFRDRASGSGATGELNGPEFLADLLEWTLHGYLSAFEEIERSLEEIDARAMKGDAAAADEGLLARLVESRREIGHLRRALTSHREAVLALTRPELDAIGDSSSAERFAVLRERLEGAVQAARDSREAVIGSFDLLLASTGQRTNEVMKLLTLVSVLLLPGSLIAGVMGMNFKLGMFENPSNFWVVLAVIAALATTTLVVARVRHWI